MKINYPSTILATFTSFLLTILFLAEESQAQVWNARPFCNIKYSFLNPGTGNLVSCAAAPTITPFYTTTGVESSTQLGTMMPGLTLVSSLTFSYGFWYYYLSTVTGNKAVLSSFTSTYPAPYAFGATFNRFIQIFQIKSTGEFSFYFMTNLSPQQGISFNTTTLSPTPGFWYHLSVGMDFDNKRVVCIVYSTETDTSQIMSGSVPFGPGITINANTGVYFMLDYASLDLSPGCSMVQDGFAVENYFLEELGAYHARWGAYRQSKLAILYLFERENHTTIRDYSGNNNFIRGLSTMQGNSGVVFNNGEFLSAVFTNPTAGGSETSMTVAFWIKSDNSLNANPSTVFQIIDSLSTQRLAVFYTTNYIVQVRDLQVPIGGIVDLQWNSVVIAVHECYYAQAFIEIMVNRGIMTRAKISPSCSLSTASPYTPPYTVKVGSYGANPFIAGNIKYLSAQFNFDIQIDYYYTCYNSCAIAMGPFCFQCNDSKVLWLDDMTCQSFTQPTFLSCPSDTALSGQCTCIPGYRFSNFKFNCEPCSDPNCLYCPNSAGVCTGCRPFYDLISGGCRKYCATGCATCLDQTDRTCLSCDPGFFLYKTFCLPSCPQGYLSDSSGYCLNCTSPCSSCAGEPGNCTACLNGLFLLPNDVACNDTCPAYYYGDTLTTKCKPCDYRCESCFGSLNTECYECKPGKVFLPSSSCFDSCPSGYYPNNDTIINTCLSCHQNCSSCWNSGSSNCLSCSDQRFYSAGGTCSACDLSCASCIGPGKTLCTSCTGSGILFNGVCLYLNCDPGTYPDANSFDCQPCPPDCPTCNSFTNCSTCIKSKVLSNFKCLDCMMTGFELINGACEETCGDGANYGYNDCDDGNLINHDGCDSTCMVEPGWKCGGGTPDNPDTCTMISAIRVNVTGNLPDTYPVITVMFTGPVDIVRPWSEAARITNLNSLQIFGNFSSLNLTNISYRIDVSYYKYDDWQEPFSINVLDQKAFLDENGTYVVFGNHKVIIDYTWFPNPDLEWRDILFIFLRVLLILPLFFSMVKGYKYRSWLSLELLQNTAMMVFLNVEFPKIMLHALDIVYGTSFYWWPNPLKIYSYDYYVDGRTPPLKYQQYQVSSLFLHNSGGLITMFIFVGIITYILGRLRRKYPKKVWIGTALSLFEMNQFKKLWLSFYMFIFNGVLVQITHVNFSEVIEFLSTVTCLIVGILLLLTFGIIQGPSIKKKKETKYKGNKRPGLPITTSDAANLFAEFKNLKSGIRYVSLQLLIKIFYVGILCTMASDPLKQCGLILIPRALSLIVTSIMRPYFRMKDTLYVIITEAFLLLSYTALLLDRLGYEATGENSIFAYVALSFMMTQLGVIVVYSLIQMVTKKPLNSDLVSQSIPIPTPFQKTALQKARKLQIIQKGRGGH